MYPGRKTISETKTRQLLKQKSSIYLSIRIQYNKVIYIFSHSNHEHYSVVDFVGKTWKRLVWIEFSDTHNVKNQVSLYHKSSEDNSTIIGKFRKWIFFFLFCH